MQLDMHAALSWTCMQHWAGHGLDNESIYTGMNMHVPCASRHPFPEPTCGLICDDLCSIIDKPTYPAPYEGSAALCRGPPYRVAYKSSPPPTLPSHPPYTRTRKPGPSALRGNGETVYTCVGERVRAAAGLLRKRCASAAQALRSTPTPLRSPLYLPVENGTSRRLEEDREEDVNHPETHKERGVQFGGPFVAAELCLEYEPAQEDGC